MREMETDPVRIVEAVSGLEMGAGREFLRLQEMQQRPQLFDAILEGCACD